MFGVRFKPTCVADFSNHFLGDLCDTPDNRIAIIEAMGRRLCMDAGEGTGSGSLGDESLGNDVRRMRVTLAARIHYERLQGRIISQASSVTAVLRIRRHA